jgi:hypothetical protein
MAAERCWFRLSLGLNRRCFRLRLRLASARASPRARWSRWRVSSSSSLEDEHVPWERRFYSDELRQEIRRRHTAGETVPQLAQKTGIPFGMVKFMCGNTRRTREPALAVGERL